MALSANYWPFQSNCLALSIVMLKDSWLPFPETETLSGNPFSHVMDLACHGTLSGNGNPFRKRNPYVVKALYVVPQYLVG